ncbi:MAG: hypothetical protein V2I37_10535 [Marinilabiliaceae bacterium]|jgi:hypothetical protein|nr:hypothetical protein [Marinilabiliaceae bacterium]
MELFRKPRLAWARFKIRKRLKSTYRNKRFNNLKNAHKIGIIWDGSFIESFSVLSDFYKRMQINNIQVDIVCFHPNKILPDEYTALRYLRCFKQSDLNYFFIPKAAEIDDFISTPYEILIDINLNNRFPLFYITSLSKAEFKIGAGNTIDSNSLDMTIELKDKTDIKYYLEQVEYYLKMINTSV